MGKGSFPLHKQAPCLPPAQTHAAAEVLGRYNYSQTSEFGGGCPSLCSSLTFPQCCGY